jgi:predicted Zn-dependent peptidase
MAVLMLCGRVGKEQQIKAWTREDVQRYHGLHYRPDNAILFLVGDIDVPAAVETIRQKFEPLKVCPERVNIIFSIRVSVASNL